MDQKRLKTFLKKIASGAMTPEEGVDRLKSLFVEDLGYANIDHHRALRCGFPEVIYCPGKTAEQIAGIAEGILKGNRTLLATRVFPAAAELLLERFPGADYNEAAKTVSAVRGPRIRKTGLVAVVTAGTSDIPVAEEARVTAALMGARVKALYDVGVAGIHRLLNHIDLLKKARVLVVVAGMEGALASVVGGLVDRPVIAVPTSVGYGASFGGVSPLLSMLNSCASNVAVVNIDNGFSAGTIAALINRRKDS
jgi:NCAIR mutase (PurE)-related protein